MSSVFHAVLGIWHAWGKKVMFSADFRGDFYKTFILSALGAGSQDEESNQGYLKYTCCRREFLRRDVSNLWKNSAKGHLPKFHPIDPAKPYKSNSQSSLPFSPARGTQTEEVWATRISRILSRWDRPKNSGQRCIVSSRLLPEPEENLTYQALATKRLRRIPDKRALCPADYYLSPRKT